MHLLIQFICIRRCRLRLSGLLIRCPSNIQHQLKNKLTKFCEVACDRNKTPVNSAQADNPVSTLPIGFMPLPTNPIIFVSFPSCSIIRRSNIDGTTRLGGASPDKLRLSWKCSLRRTSKITLFMSALSLVICFPFHLALSLPSLILLYQAGSRAILFPPVAREKQYGARHQCRSSP